MPTKRQSCDRCLHIAEDQIELDPLSVPYPVLQRDYEIKIISFLEDGMDELRVDLCSEHFKELNEEINLVEKLTALRDRISWKITPVG